MKHADAKRILLLTPSMSKGGAEKQLLKIAVYMRQKGHAVSILSLSPINEFKSELADTGVPVIFLKSWKSNPLDNCRRLNQVLKQIRPQVVIAFMFIAIIFARLLKPRFRFRLISSIRISVLPGKWLLPFRLTSGDDVIVYNSLGSMLTFERKFPGLKSGLVIHNEITIPRVSEDLRLSKKIFTWVCIGHFRWNKDYMTLFKALERIRNKEFRMLIVGELNGAVWPALMLQEYGVWDKVTLLGFIADPGQFLADADGFVLSSFSEGMPNATLEAMAMAKPIVITDIDGNRELVEGSGGGILSKPKDDADLATCMAEIMDMDHKARIEMGERGRAYIGNHFNGDKVLQQWEALLENVQSHI